MSSTESLLPSFLRSNYSVDEMEKFLKKQEVAFKNTEKLINQFSFMELWNIIGSNVNENGSKDIDLLVIDTSSKENKEVVINKQVVTEIPLSGSESEILSKKEKTFVLKAVERMKKIGSEVTLIIENSKVGIKRAYIGKKMSGEDLSYFNKYGKENLFFGSANVKFAGGRAVAGEIQISLHIDKPQYLNKDELPES